jgi:hypothetical protein
MSAVSAAARYSLSESTSEPLPVCVYVCVCVCVCVLVCVYVVPFTQTYKKYASSTHSEFSMRLF